VTGLSDSFEIREPPTEIDALLRDPNPNARLWMTVSAWSATGDLLTVAFSYGYLSLAGARPLWRFLAGATDYPVKIVESDAAGYWSVEGRIQKPTYVTLEFLNKWVNWMAVVGFEHGARYLDWSVARSSPSAGARPRS
jgi:hypothetical protein